jgi:hypothetical protein
VDIAYLVRLSLSGLGGVWDCRIGRTLRQIRC